MTQEEFNAMLAVALSGGLGGGSYVHLFSGEEMDALLSLMGYEHGDPDLTGFLRDAQAAKSLSEQYRNDAKRYAESSEASAEDAETQKISATEQAEAAEGYKNQAYASAQSAATSAATADASASEAAGYARQAAAHTDLPLAHGQSGRNSLVVGDTANNSAYGDFAYAEGKYTLARRTGSHAEGVGSEATGVTSHAEGYYAQAAGDYSHAEGNGTIAGKKAQHVFGEYNRRDGGGSITVRGNYIEIVGNGENETATSNARTLDWSGNEQLQGALYVNENTLTATLDENKRVLAAFNTASAFGSTASYPVGSYCIYDGSLYRCTTAHTGAWDASHFTPVSVGGDIASYLPTLFAPAGYGLGGISRQIAATDNIDNLTDGGFYYCSSTAAASVAGTTPFGSSGFGMLVMPMGTGSTPAAAQIAVKYISGSGTGTEIKLRFVRSGAPLAWQTIALT